MYVNKKRLDERKTTDDQSDFSLTAASESLLVATAQRGDHLAYAELCKRHHEMVFRTVLRITGNVDDTEDVLQDSRMKAFIHIKSFDRRSAFSTWMTSIAINSALMLLRKKRKQKEFSLDDSLDPDNRRLIELIELSRNPEERCIETERQMLVRQAIRRLPSQLRTAIEIRLSRDCSIHEIAMMLGVSVPAMKARLLRARLRLREPLRDALKEGTVAKVVNHMKGAAPTRRMQDASKPSRTKTFNTSSEALRVAAAQRC